MNTKITTAVSVVVGAVIIVALTLWVASFTLFVGTSGGATSLTLLQAKPTIEKIDAGKEGVLTFFEADLSTVSGETAGVVAGSILTVDVTEDGTGFESRQRTLTFDTPDGQIQAAGLSNYPTVERELATGDPFVVSVVGGTGKYLGVTGEVQTKHLADGSYEHIFTFVAH